VAAPDLGLPRRAPSTGRWQPPPPAGAAAAEDVLVGEAVRAVPEAPPPAPGPARREPAPPIIPEPPPAMAAPDRPGAAADPARSLERPTAAGPVPAAPAAGTPVPPAPARVAIPVGRQGGTSRARPHILILGGLLLLLAAALLGFGQADETGGPGLLSLCAAPLGFALLLLGLLRLATGRPGRRL